MSNVMHTRHFSPYSLPDVLIQTSIHKKNDFHSCLGNNFIGILALCYVHSIHDVKGVG
jgi:hypothetical protein